MSWFRSKPKSLTSFRAHARNGLFDLHAHVLPDLDDGAWDFDESNAMLDKLDHLGFVTVTSTPHFDLTALTPDVARQTALIDVLSEQRGGKGPEIRVGAEVLFDDRFLAHEKNGAVPGIGGQAVYLVEFGFFPGSVPLGAEEQSFRFHLKEKQLILAHPERIPDLQRDFGKTEALRRSGMLFQLDVMSLVGKYGRRAQQTAVKMLDEEMIDVASTDLHHERDIETLASALSSLLSLGEDVFEQLFSIAPSRIHEGRAEEIRSNA